MYSMTTTSGDGSKVAFTIPFPFNSINEISVSVNGVTATIDYISGGLVYLTTAPANGAVVQIKRTTDMTERVVDFVNTARLKEADLDNSNIQVFNAIQEALDRMKNSIEKRYDGTWDAQGNRITDVANPEAAQDAATKDYVDNSPNAAKAAAEQAAAEAQAAAEKLGNATIEVIDLVYGADGYGVYDPDAGRMTLYVPAGPAGAVGPTGPAGPVGLQGPQGIQGPTGPQGLKGDQGAQGNMGPTGPAGPQGPVGPEGQQGIEGPVGPAGPIGQTGPTGPQGPQGIQGLQGPQGDQGPQGVSGPDGAVGPQGPMGATPLGLAFGQFSITSGGHLQIEYYGTANDNDFTILPDGTLEVTIVS